MANPKYRALNSTVMPFSTLRGFRDYLPPDAGTRSELFRRMRSVAQRCGYSELETPSIEPLELYQVKSGDEITGQTWSFTDKGGRSVALVSETTPSLARVFVDRAKSEPLPVKWFTVSKLWRYEEPQSGRTREFQQFNLDILGAAGIRAEVDLLSTAALLLDELGAEDLYTFRINDRELSGSIGAQLGVTDFPRYLRVLDRYRKLSAEAFALELEAVGVTSAKVPALADLLADSEKGVSLKDSSDYFGKLRALGLDKNGRESLDRLQTLLSTLQRLGLGDRVVFDLTVVRGLAYYTSTVFEAFAKKGASRSLFGGGRYDQLIGLFGGPSTPACGLALGDQILEQLLREADRWGPAESALDTFVVAVTPQEAPLAMEWVERLRRSGLSADSDLMTRSLSRQLKEAGRRKARRALILGPKEVARGVVVERDLTTGSQREIPMRSLLPPE